MKNKVNKKFIHDEQFFIVKKIMIIKYKKALCQILAQCFFYFLETIYLEYL